MSSSKLLTKKQKTALVSLILTLIALLLARFTPGSESIQQAAQQHQPGLYHVSKFIDGDTLAVKMSGSTEKIRFIGVDTPETHDPRKAVQCFGQAAADFTKQLIGQQPIRLESDQLSTDRDRYNRLLRYVYLSDGRLVNAEIIRHGYGFAYTSFPFSKSDLFRQLEQTARQQNRGLWGNCQPTKNQYGGYTSNDAI